MIRKFMIAALGALTLGAVLPASAQEAVRVVDQEIERAALEVVQVRGNLLTARREGVAGREVYRIPFDVPITVEGQEVDLKDLKPGQKVRLYVTRTEEGWVIVNPADVIVEEDVVVVEPAPAPVYTPEPEPMMLPSTAGPLPLLALIGLFFTGLGASLSLRRRR
jgi:uncharacterized protein (DUF58 family)